MKFLSEIGKLGVYLCIHIVYNSGIFIQLSISERERRGSARPGVLYTEYLGSGWYAGYACLGWG